jgi:6-phosphogluconate dehydrogenase
MQLGFIGLGKMGLNMVTRLRRGGHDVVAYDRSADAVTRAAATGASGVSSLNALVA